MRVNDVIEINPHSGKNVHICQLTKTHNFGINDSFSNAIEFSDAKVNGEARKVYLPTMELIRFYFLTTCSKKNLSFLQISSYKEKHVKWIFSMKT